MSLSDPSQSPNAYGTPTWENVLGELEVQVLEADEILASARAEEIASWNRRASSWLPPSALGPLPEELRERAARLLQSQIEATERIVAQITHSKRQRDVAARMSYAPPSVPAYFDEAL